MLAFCISKSVLGQAGCINNWVFFSFSRGLFSGIVFTKKQDEDLGATSSHRRKAPCWVFLLLEYFRALRQKSLIESLISCFSSRDCWKFIIYLLIPVWGVVPVHRNEPSLEQLLSFQQFGVKEPWIFCGCYFLALLFFQFANTANKINTSLKKKNQVILGVF